MNSINPSISSVRRTLVVATVILTAGGMTAFGQSSSSPSSGTSTTGSSSSNYNSSYNNPGSSATNSGTNSSMSSTDATSSLSSEKKLSWSDRRFVTKAADDGQAEVQIAQLAAQKANNPDVRNFAQQMADQHTQVNSQLMSLANSKNVKLDNDSGKDRVYKRLNKATGSDFDREFVDHMVDEHEKDIKMYEKAAADAKDPDVKQFASTTLEHLRQHLAQAQQLQQSIVPTGRTGSDSWKSRSNSSTSGTNSGTTTPGSSSDMSSGSTTGTSGTSTSSLR